MMKLREMQHEYSVEEQSGTALLPLEARYVITMVILRAGEKRNIDQIRGNGEERHVRELRFRRRGLVGPPVR